MGLPSTDPRCFAVHRRQREIAREEGVDPDIALEIAKEEVIARPQQARDVHERQAFLYRELRQSHLWAALRVDLETAELDHRVRRIDGRWHATVPSIDALMRIYQGRVLERILDDHEDEMLEPLLRVLEESIANRLELGVYAGGEHVRALMLRDWIASAQVNYDLSGPSVTDEY